jgi:hypothetical protein
MKMVMIRVREYFFKSEPQNWPLCCFSEQLLKIPKLKFDFPGQCCRSKTVWCRPGSGSESADPCLGLKDPDPAIFAIDLQDVNKKLIFYKVFCVFELYLKRWKATMSGKIRVMCKKSTKRGVYIIREILFGEKIRETRLH